MVLPFYCMLFNDIAKITFFYHKTLNLVFKVLILEKKVLSLQYFTDLLKLKCLFY